MNIEIKNNLWTEAKAWTNSLPDGIKELPFDFLQAETPNDQLVAAYAICSGKYDSVMLSGRAGSGKTYVLKACRLILQLLGCEVRICASTGIASKNAGGEGTINRFANLGDGTRVAPKGYKDFCGSHWTRKGILDRVTGVLANFDQSETKDLVIFIDEVSMCSSEILLLTYQVMSEALPNRRIRWVGTGDLRQLLTVDKLKGFPWKSFCSLFYEEARFHFAGTPEDKVIRYGSMFSHAGPFEIGKGAKRWNYIGLSLLENRRQEGDSWFANSLNAIGDGHKFGHPEVAKLLCRVWVPKKGKYVNALTGDVLPDLEGAIHVFNTNDAVARHNRKALESAKRKISERALSEMKSVLTPEEVETQADEIVSKALDAKVRTYKIDIRPGEMSKSEILDEISPMEEDMELAVGCKFMVRLNLDNQLTNGTVGVITQLEATRIQIQTRDGNLVWVNCTDIPLSVNSKGIPKGNAFGLPGVLCHGMTPWKTQGLTFSEPLVYEVESRHRVHGRLYVAASRVTSPEYLYLLATNQKQLDDAVYSSSKIASFIQLVESIMLVALGRHPAIWTRQDGKVWVQDLLVQEVQYVERPKAELVEDSESCAIYRKKIGEDNYTYGMFVKDKEKIAEGLKTETGYEWFKEHIDFVWFKSE